MGYQTLPLDRKVKKIKKKMKERWEKECTAGKN
jgi:hypothetical protein